MSRNKNTTRQNKKLLLEALEKTLGVVSTACKLANVSRGVFYEYYNKDEKFRQQVDEIEQISIDFAESQLLKQIKGGNTTATIFYLKTKGKARGYVEKQEVGLTGENPFLEAMKEASRLRREEQKNGQD
jgi:hypothetical protein